MELWIKALHVISVISWMAASLYMPRLFVNHCEAEPGSQMDLALQGMERRLMKAIMTPSMIATWIFGLWIAALNDVWTEPWFIIKFLCVIGIAIQHMACAKWLRLFAKGANVNSARFYRIVNEVPAVLMVIIVVMVVVRPF